MIRILTQIQYDAICDIVTDLQKENEDLKLENNRLARDLKDLQNFCMNFAADQKSKAIDFPNSYSDHKASKLFDNIY